MGCVKLNILEQEQALNKSPLFILPPIDKKEVPEIFKVNYSTFGMEQPGRTFNAGNYRFGFNSMEKDPEIKGGGNSYTTEFRQYDPRLGRWLSLDPLMRELPNWSPYVAFENNPIIYNDPLGLKVKKDKEKKEKTYDNPEQKALDYAKEKGILNDVFARKLDDGSIQLYYKGDSEQYKEAFKDEEVGGVLIVKGGYFKASKKARKEYLAALERREHPGMFHTSQTDLENHPEWVKNRAKCATIDAYTEAAFLEVFYFATGEEVFRFVGEGFHAWRVARLAKIAPNGEGIAKLGKWGESQLAKYLGYAGEKPAKAFSTSLGKRFVDRMVNGIAHEVKAGINVTLTSSVKKQILKDAELIAKGRIQGAVWHFMQGADAAVLDFLESNGISYVLH